MKATVYTRKGKQKEGLAVRLGLQGWGSVELDITGTGLFFDATELFCWRTLAQVLSHPDVTGVTFAGPWTDENLPDTDQLVAQKAVPRMKGH